MAPAAAKKCSQVFKSERIQRTFLSLRGMRSLILMGCCVLTLPSFPDDVFSALLAILCLLTED